VRYRNSWGGWAFNVTGVQPGPPLPPPPPPNPGWGEWEHCTSCLPSNPVLKALGTGQTVSICQAACENTTGCKYINFALGTNQDCNLFQTCDSPSHQAPGKCNGNDWWSTMQYSGHDHYSPHVQSRYQFHGAEEAEKATTAAPIWSLGISGGQQTGQQGSLAISGNDYFVENIFEELDAPGEFFLQTAQPGHQLGPILFLIPPTGVSLDHDAPIRMEAAVHPRVVQLRGSNDVTFAHDIVLRDVHIVHSAPTYMADYEMPSGGDWSLHRGGAVFLDGTEDVVVQNVTVDQAGGNGIFLSNHAWRTNLTDNTIAHAGDSAILLVGSTDLMNGTRNTYPAFTSVTGNLCYEMGYYGKQTAAVFKSIAYQSYIGGNVFFNSPRSLVNFNDAFRGGDMLVDNVMWGAVTETADHAR